MSDSFQKKTSSFIVTGIIAVVVISFMFSGYQGMKGAPDTLAKVDGYEVRYREFQQEFDRQLQFYSQMMGGAPLSQAQIEKMNLKEGTLRNLINRKLVLVFASQLGISPAQEQVKKEIKELPYFQSNGQFDLERYKLILANARLTPTEFESDVKEQLTGQLAQNALRDFPISKKFMQSLSDYKAQRRVANIVQLRKAALKDLIPVSDQEIKTFLADDKNQSKLEGLFKARKPTLDKPEQIKVRHILLTTDEKNQQQVEKKITDIRKNLTPKNFAKMAKSYSQDPGSKDKGGDLGLVGKGRMVPEFEKAAFDLKEGTISQPVKSPFGYHLIYVEKHNKAISATLNEHQVDLARELIREGKKDELEALVAATKTKIETLMKQSKMEQIKKLPEASKMTIEMNTTINRLDGANGQVQLEAKTLQEVFAQDHYFKVDDLPGVVTIIETRTLNEKENSKESFDLKSETEELKLALARTLNNEVLEHLKETSSIKVYNILN